MCDCYFLDIMKGELRNKKGVSQIEGIKIAIHENRAKSILCIKEEDFIHAELYYIPSKNIFTDGMIFEYLRNGVLIVPYKIIEG